MSTIVLLVPFAITALKIAGVLYLMYLAVLTWRAPATLALHPGLSGGKGNPSRYFVQGLTNNLTNPKMIAFFLALFPQFVHPEHGSLALQSVVLGTTLALMAVGWIGLIVFAVGRFRTAVVRNTGVVKLVIRLAAVTFVGLACRLAVEESR